VANPAAVAAKRVARNLKMLVVPVLVLRQTEKARSI